MKVRHVVALFRQYYTLNNIVIGVAILIALGWVWGTMDTLQNNFRLQTQVDTLRQDVERNDLQAQTLELENQYYASDEYLELEAREKLGKAIPGEHLLILPANTVIDKVPTEKNTALLASTGNFQSWLTFFFGNRE